MLMQQRTVQSGTVSPAGVDVSTASPLPPPPPPPPASSTFVAQQPQTTSGGNRARNDRLSCIKQNPKRARYVGVVLIAVASVCSTVVYVVPTLSGYDSIEEMLGGNSTAGNCDTDADAKSNATAGADGDDECGGVPLQTGLMVGVGVIFAAGFSLFSLSRRALNQQRLERQQQQQQPDDSQIPRTMPSTVLSPQPRISETTNQQQPASPRAQSKPSIAAAFPPPASTGNPAYPSNVPPPPSYSSSTGNQTQYGATYGQDNFVAINQWNSQAPS